ncbi:hypothetical protein OS122_07440 [Mycolicibacterium mucogenicum]|uniref:hypothetical protein n=1 Tax=Mycolicibacterium mucogenicum TaxID=56689 RepID=UPI00226A11DA|nr:hypothetical protein [Mycolicibacterium mucogenicum]MCX8560714.1 hypothetical protein [Mycolicibacterium mucogenicum]
MDLMWRVVALTVATFTVLLAVRRIVMAVSGLVFERYVAVGGLAAFSVDRGDNADDTYRVRFEVGGPAVFHNVTVQLFGMPESAAPAPPALRHTMIAGDDPIDWTFRLPGGVAAQTWVTVTWVRPYLQGVESEALAHWLQADRPYEWRWYSETNRYVRTVIRFVARRWSVGGESLRELPLYGRWRRTSSNNSNDLLGPAATPPPRT